MSSIHQFNIEAINGGLIELSDYIGKKLMLVNVASKCGYTKQYAQLEELYQNHGDKLGIIGFPSNDFGGQEPGTAEEIYAFCRKEYNISFPLSKKIHVKGAKKHPIYKWLTDSSLNGNSNSKVNWNFQKYLIDEEGQIDAILSPANDPMSEVIFAWIGV